MAIPPMAGTVQRASADFECLEYVGPLLTVGRHCLGQTLESRNWQTLWEFAGLQKATQSLQTSIETSLRTVEGHVILGNSVEAWGICLRWTLESQMWKGNPIPWTRRHILATSRAAHVAAILLGAAAEDGDAAHGEAEREPRCDYCSCRSKKVKVGLSVRLRRCVASTCATLGYQMRSTPRRPGPDTGSVLCAMVS